MVAGCLLPIFGSYEPSKFDPNTVADYLKVLVAGLEPYVDFWLGETLSLVAEAQAVRERDHREATDREDRLHGGGP